ncbi:MAG: DUF2868 domain-containing protein [Burkholderiaceae bacterium]
MSQRQHRPQHSDVLLAETVRLIEADGPLEDSEAMGQAFRTAQGREERLLERARLLSQRLKLDHELARWRELAVYVWLGLAVLTFIVAYGIAATLLGSGRSINAVLAFVGVLGMHAFTLVLWLLALLFSVGKGGGSGGRISLGNLFLRLVAWLPVDRGQHSLTMARAAGMLLRRTKLAPWAFGFISHSIWAAAYALVLAALWFGFSFREYRLSWETTILHADFFVRFVQVTGWLPAKLGFPVPDSATLLTPYAANADQRAWAWWLIGCTAVYGLLVRLILAAISWLVWRRGKNSLHLDTSDPYFRKLLARFEQMENSLVVDSEQPYLGNDGHHALSKEGASQAKAVVGFELPDDAPWPPFDWPASVALQERIAGMAQERRRVLDKLAQLRPAKLLLVCNQASTPDRGTERFLREAAGSAAQCAVLLVSSTNPAEEGTARWQRWLQDTEMHHIAAMTDAQQALAWLEDASDHAMDKKMNAP